MMMGHNAKQMIHGDMVIHFFNSTVPCRLPRKLVLVVLMWSLLAVFGVRVSVMFHFMFVHYTFSF